MSDTNEIGFHDMLAYETNLSDGDTTARPAPLVKGTETTDEVAAQVTGSPPTQFYEDVDTSCTHKHPQMGCTDCGAWFPPLNLNQIRDNALSMIASGINHDLSPDDEEYIKGQIDWALRQVVLQTAKQPARHGESATGLDEIVKREALNAWAIVPPHDRPTAASDYESPIRRACEEALEMQRAAVEKAATELADKHAKQVESMRQQLDEANRLLRLSEMRIKEKQQQLQQAEADTDRLDWLFDYAEKFLGEKWSRAAIDEARKK